MAYWAAVQFHGQRERMATHFLTLAGFTIWLPRFRERCIIRGRRQHVLRPLFPGYLFLLIELQWHAAKTAPGVTRLVMDGLTPARVPDRVIEELRGKERNGVIELPKPPPRLRPGGRVKVVQGPFRGHLGLCVGMTPHERVTVLLSLLGSQQRPRRARGPLRISL
jgi:transcriptional antiterminator RfaH